MSSTSYYLFFFFNDTATTEIYTLSLHDALPIYRREQVGRDLGLHGDARRDEFLEPDVALHGDDRAGAGARQPVHRLGDLLGHRLALALREAAHEARLPETRERVPQLGLVYHHHRERPVGEDDAQQE